MPHVRNSSDDEQAKFVDLIDSAYDLWLKQSLRELYDSCKMLSPMSGNLAIDNLIMIVQSVCHAVGQP